MTENGHDIYPTKEQMEAARQRAQEKMADDLVAAEMGTVEPEKSPRKGPLPIPNELRYEIKLDLAPHTAQLVIDGTIYQHGGSYSVPERVYQMMREMISRGWEHQGEIEGKNRDAYRHEKNINIKPMHLRTAPEKILRP